MTWVPYPVHTWYKSETTNSSKFSSNSYVCCGIHTQHIHAHTYIHTSHTPYIQSHTHIHIIHTCIHIYTTTCINIQAHIKLHIHACTQMHRTTYTHTYHIKIRIAHINIQAHILAHMKKKKMLKNEIQSQTALKYSKSTVFWFFVIPIFQGYIVGKHQTNKLLLSIINISNNF